LAQLQAWLLECGREMGRLGAQLAPFVSQRPEILFFCPEAGSGVRVGSRGCGSTGSWSTTTSWSSSQEGATR